MRLYTTGVASGALSLSVIALRTASASHTDAILGEGSGQAGAWAHRIGQHEQGMAYRMGEGLRKRGYRGFFEVVFCSMEIAGESPSIWSTSGFCISSRNWRA